jgi:hypothetical protein
MVWKAAKFNKGITTVNALKIRKCKKHTQNILLALINLVVGPWVSNNNCKHIELD